MASVKNDDITGQVAIDSYLNAKKQLLARMKIAESEIKQERGKDFFAFEQAVKEKYSLD